MKVRLLTMTDKPALRELLEVDRYSNLFLFTMMQDQFPNGNCMLGVWQDEHLVGCLYRWPRHLCVPFVLHDQAASALAQIVSTYDPAPRVIMGRRTTIDRFTQDAGWEFPISHPHVIMVCEEMKQGGTTKVRQAAMRDIDQIVENGIQLNQEDLKLDFSRGTDWITFRVSAVEAIGEGRVWVVEESGKILFQMIFSYHQPWACHVGGIWTVPEARGRGIAFSAISHVGQMFLADGRKLVLEVREDNHSAINLYKKLGFNHHEQLRMMVRREDESAV